MAGFPPSENGFSSLICFSLLIALVSPPFPADVIGAWAQRIEDSVEQMNIEEAEEFGRKMVAEAERRGKLKDWHLDTFAAAMALKGNKFILAS